MGGTVMRICGSQKCPECRGRGEVDMGERHGAIAYDLCPVCKGNGTIPIYRHVPWCAEDMQAK